MRKFKLKHTVKKIISTAGYQIRKVDTPRTAASNLNEDEIIRKLVNGKNIRNFCVDIGASNGVDMSNTNALFNTGWEGLAIECDPIKIPTLASTFAPTKAFIANLKVNPENVLDIFQAFGVPKDFGLLSIDIDGYDYYVIREILSKYKPSVICAEINEKIPPPIKFTVEYNPDYFWDSSHFYGQSISQLHPLMVKNGYTLHILDYNNVFYVDKEKYKGEGLTAEQGYKQGYLDRPDRREKFPWNDDFEIAELPREKKIEFIREKFKGRDGEYTIS